MAEEALGAGEQIETDDLPYPPAAKRILQAREAIGLTQDDVAGLWGEQPSMYWDLELFDSETFDVISIQQLVNLAAVLKTPPLSLLFGENPVAPLPRTTFAEVVSRLRARWPTRPCPRTNSAIGWAGNCRLCLKTRRSSRTCRSSDSTGSASRSASIGRQPCRT